MWVRILIDDFYRYDGIYKVVKYYKVTNNDNVTWKFHLRRDDNEPAPWTSSGIAFTREMSVGFLEVIFLSNHK